MPRLLLLRMITSVAALSALTLAVATGNFFKPPTELESVQYIDLNGDSLPDAVVQAVQQGDDLYFSNDEVARAKSWINNGCGWVDAATITENAPLTMCVLPTTLSSSAPMYDSRVGNLLQSAGLGHYTELFAWHEVDFDALLMLSDSDLAAIGIQAVGARKRLSTVAAAERSRQRSERRQLETSALAPCEPLSPTSFSLGGGHQHEVVHIPARRDLVDGRGSTRIHRPQR